MDKSTNMESDMDPQDKKGQATITEISEDTIAGNEENDTKSGAEPAEAVQ